MKIARRAAVPAFAVMEIVAAANARRAAGQSIINLCVGEPTTGASDAVRDLAQEILATGSLGYTEAMGSPALRRAIAAHYDRWYGADVDPSRVAVTTGSSGGFMLAFLAAFDVGDRVALVRPLPRLPEHPRVAGLRRRRDRLRPCRGIRADARTARRCARRGAARGPRPREPRQPDGHDGRRRRARPDRLLVHVRTAYA